jgi:hypothetical protein
MKFLRSNLPLWLLLFCSVTNAQQKITLTDENKLTNLKRQVDSMGTAFVNADYNTFCKYTYPAVLKSMGGAQKMGKFLSETTDEIKEKGMSFSKITYGEPGKIFKSGKELQATIPQSTEIKLRRGRVVSTSTLIAFSSDNGMNWTFVDASDKSMVMLRRSLPNISKEITLPPHEKPVQYPE